MRSDTAETLLNALTADTTDAAHAALAVSVSDGSYLHMQLSAADQVFTPAESWHCPAVRSCANMAKQGLG